VISRHVLWSIAGLTLVFAACNKSDSPRTYDEIGFHPKGRVPVSEVMNASPVDVEIHWVKPGNWIMKDSTNGMRTASFAVVDSSLMNMGEVDPNAVDVSVTHFAGNAGGIDRNIQRWMGQIGLHLDSIALAEFIHKAKPFTTKSNEKGIYVDFTTMLSGDLTQDKTIFGAIVPAESYTVFVKAMGERRQVEAAKNSVEAFCRSLLMKSGGT
jgi:hypothetical protein